jgi:hypothetical protein
VFTEGGANAFVSSLLIASRSRKVNQILTYPGKEGKRPFGKSFTFDFKNRITWEMSSLKFREAESGGFPE